MKFYLYLILLITSCNVVIGQKLNIDKDLKELDHNRYTDFYICKEKEYLFEEGISTVKFVNNDTIYIENESNTGYSGIHISFKIDRKLNISNVEYYTWDDIENGSSTDYEIQEVYLTLNKNPFEKGVRNLMGIYKLKVKSDFDPGKILSKEGVKPKIKIFNYTAAFECK